MGVLDHTVPGGAAGVRKGPLVTGGCDVRDLFHVAVHPPRQILSLSLQELGVGKVPQPAQQHRRL